MYYFIYRVQKNANTLYVLVKVKISPEIFFLKEVKLNDI